MATPCSNQCYLAGVCVCKFLRAHSEHENARRIVCADCYFESSEGYPRSHAPDCPRVVTS